VKKHIGIILIGIALVALLLLYAVSFTVRWQEEALVVTFGKISRVETEPGLKWMWPWQEVVTFDGRVRTLQQEVTQTQTSDEQNIVVSIYLNWRISDPEVFYQRFRSSGTLTAEDVVDSAEKTINTWVSQAGNVFTKYDLDELVTVDSSKFKLPDIEADMLAHIAAQAVSEGSYGVEIVDLGISRLGVPDSVSKSVFMRMREDRAAEERLLIADGERQAAVIIGRAIARATSITAEAEALAKDIEGQGDALAAEYYPQFLANPELANFLRKLTTLRRTLGQRTTVTIDAKTAPYELLKSGPEIAERIATPVESD